MRYVNFTKDTFLFQFHKGPIKAYYDYKTNYDIVLFQFHKGPIKAHCIFR